MLMRFGASKAMTRPDVRIFAPRSAALKPNTTARKLPEITVRNDPTLWRDRRGAGHQSRSTLSSRVVIQCSCRPRAVSLDLSFRVVFQRRLFLGGGVRRGPQEHHLVGRPAGRHQNPGRPDGRRGVQRPDQPAVWPICSASSWRIRSSLDELPGWMSHLGVQTNYTNIQPFGQAAG